MKLIRAGQAARLLGVDPDTLRRRAAGRNHTERRFDEDEVRRLLVKLKRRS